MREIPKWLKEMVGKSKAAYYTQDAVKIKENINKGCLSTVCTEAKCPNRGECFSLGDATVMILGSVCTRSCKFCAVNKACKPLPPESDEPERVADLTKEQNIKYLVLTMPTRDDLPDGGAKHIYEVIKKVKEVNPAVKVEPLISDLGGKFEFLPIILKAEPEVLAHNIETVPSLYQAVRTGANYKRSLNLLKEVKKINPVVYTKSGIMLGLGETKEELKATMQDLVDSGCDLLTLGQYLAPSSSHYTVKEYIEQPFYDELKEYGLSIGFKGIMAGPLVRSSYKAGLLYKEATQKDNEDNR
jgi:lipoic acid synthetase